MAEWRSSICMYWIECVYIYIMWHLMSHCNSCLPWVVWFLEELWKECCIYSLGIDSRGVNLVSGNIFCLFV